MTVRHITHKSRTQGTSISGERKCKLCSSTKRVALGVWQDKKAYLCKECSDAIRKNTYKKPYREKKYAPIDSPKPEPKQDPYDLYMQKVIAQREKNEQKRLDGERHMAAMVSQMKRDFENNEIKPEKPKTSHQKKLW